VFRVVDTEVLVRNVSYTINGAAFFELNLSVEATHLPSRISNGDHKIRLRIKRVAPSLRSLRLESEQLAGLCPPPLAFRAHYPTHENSAQMMTTLKIKANAICPGIPLLNF